MYHCGIDLASKTSALCVIDEEGTIVRRIEVETNESGFAKALGDLKGLNCVVEAAPMAEWTKRSIESLGHQCTIIDTRTAKRLMEARKKTDKRDAKTLAELARAHFYRPVHAKSESARLLRTQLRARQAMVDDVKRQASRVRGLCRAHAIKIGRVGKKQFCERVRERVSDACPELLVMLEPLLEAYSHADKASQSMKKAIAAVARQVVPKCIMSVPGIGPVVSLAYVATIDDPHRFQRGKQVGDYVGLASSVYQSGETAHQGRITCEGDNLLRALLVEAATVLLSRYQGDCALKRWGLKLAAEKGVGKARVAVARKLAVLLWTLWRRNEDFQAFPA